MSLTDVKFAAMQEKVDEATALLKAMASRPRLMLLCMLVDGERSVGALATDLGLRDTVVSQHLGLLRRDGLVQGRRVGQTVYYSLAGEEVQRLLATLHDIYCASDTDRPRL